MDSDTYYKMREFCFKKYLFPIITRPHEDIDNYVESNDLTTSRLLQFFTDAGRISERNSVGILTCTHASIDDIADCLVNTINFQNQSIGIPIMLPMGISSIEEYYSNNGYPKMPNSYAVNYKRKISYTLF